jgi:hypothetical protein
MDYFTIGGKPFLLRFPPHIPGIFNPNRLGGYGAGSDQPFLALQAFQQAQVLAYQAQAWLVQSQALAAQQAAQQGNSPLQSLGGQGGAQFGQFVPYSQESPEVAPEPEQEDDGHIRAPKALHQGFKAPEQVQMWDPMRFEVIQKLQDATRNRGQVHLMRDGKFDRLVAVKQMPNMWIASCHSAFVGEHPRETELPWQDVGCVKFLNSQE